METKPLKTITIEEQRAMGLLRSSTGGPKLVPAVVEKSKPNSAPPPQTPVTLEVTPTAMAAVDFRTSAKDRAVGFLIASIPRTFAFSLAITILSIVVGGVTLAIAFVILFGTFAVVELVSYVYTLAISAEGTANYEARQKWAVIRREQEERWRHYRLGGG